MTGWRQANPEKRRQESERSRVRRVQRTKNDPEYRQRGNDACRHQHHKIKLEVFEAYGGLECVCCGETGEQFLTIDHIENDGAEHRRLCGITSGSGMYRWLREHRYPDGYQVLCYNCNNGKRVNNGVCPHKTQGSTP